MRRLATALARAPAGGRMAFVPSAAAWTPRAAAPAASAALRAVGQPGARRQSGGAGGAGDDGESGVHPDDIARMQRVAESLRENVLEGAKEMQAAYGGEHADKVRGGAPPKTTPPPPAGGRDPSGAAHRAFANSPPPHPPHRSG
jgi:hypothetical protein